jgi:hypothetical protein
VIGLHEALAAATAHADAAAGFSQSAGAADGIAILQPIQTTELFFVMNQHT